MLSPSERSLRAQIAANTRWSRADGAEGTAAARAAFLAKFEAEVDPNNELSPAERQRRAERARKAHFQRLALKSAQARRKGGASDAA
jgi:hypothetical protein